MKGTALSLTLVLALVLSPGLARPLTAQAVEVGDGAGCGTCGDYESEQGPVHIFGLNGGAVFGCGNVCHRYFVQGICYDNHGPCISLRANIEKVRLALETSDLRTLRTVLVDLGDKATINRSARAIEVFGCGPIREVVARFPRPSRS